MQLKDWKLSSLCPLQKNLFLLFVTTYVFNMYPLIWQFQLQCVLWELDALQCVIQQHLWKESILSFRLIMSFVAIFVFLTKFVALNHTHINPKLFPFCILLHFNTFYPVCDSNNEIANVAWMMSIQRKNSHVIL